MSAAWLVVIDMQHVFADLDSPWYVPRFDEVLEPVEALVAAHAPRVTLTRFVAPAVATGAWATYYDRFPFALQPPDAELYRLVPGFARHAAAGTLDATTFSKWTPELAERLGPDGELVLAGVATEACVLGTALAAADAGVRVRVAADACAGADDDAHEHALAVMRLWSPLIEVTSTERILPSGEAPRAAATTP